MVLKRNGNKLSIVTSKDGINSLEELLKEIAKVNCPLVLSINGKGIIYKNLNEKFNSTYQDALQKVFPTGNEAEFHVQLFHGFSDNVFIAVIRKEILNEIISLFNASKLSVINVVLGMYTTEMLLPFLNEQSSLQKIKLNNTSILFEDGRWKEIIEEPNEEQTKINFGDEQIDSTLLLPLSAAMTYFIGFNQLSNNNNFLKQAKKEAEHKKAFVTFSRVLIGFLFLISVSNAFFFNKYFQKKNRLDSELLVFQGSLQNYDKLKKQLTDKKDFLDKSGLLVGSRTSYYTDRLLYDMPDEVQLTYFNMYPYTNTTEEDSVPKFENKRLLIKGICTKSIFLNEWMKLLKSKDFVQDVFLGNYNQESKSVIGKFDLDVKLK